MTLHRIDDQHAHDTLSVIPGPGYALHAPFPHWARFAAVDANGALWAYDQLPELFPTEDPHQTAFWFGFGRMKCVGRAPQVRDWRASRCEVPQIDGRAPPVPTLDLPVEPERNPLVPFLAVATFVLAVAGIVWAVMP